MAWCLPQRLAPTQVVIIPTPIAKVTAEAVPATMAPKGWPRGLSRILIRPGRANVLNTPLPLCLQGLVLPPRLAPTQVVVIPIPNAKLAAEAVQAMMDTVDGFVTALAALGVRAISDKRDVYTPGWKYNHWEVKVRNTKLAQPALPQGGWGPYAPFMTSSTSTCPN